MALTPLRAPRAGSPQRLRPPQPARAVFRCDGDEQVGAGHVARCLTLATALQRLGWQTSFAGAYGGLAAWLLERARADVVAGDPDGLCGLPAGERELVVLDSYTIEPSAICELAAVLPVLTLAEANRCPERGVLLDYHLDAQPARGPRLLAGPAFALVDPAFAASARRHAYVDRLLVSVGGSRPADALLDRIAAAAAVAFPDAEIAIAEPGSGAAAAPAGQESETTAPSNPRFARLPQPCSLIDIVPHIDLAITAAGLTSYELACAGVPQLAIAIADNQRRVVDGLRRHDLAPCLDLIRGDSLAGLPAALLRLRDPGLRSRLAGRGIRLLDGRGAERAAVALTELLGDFDITERYRPHP